MAVPAERFAASSGRVTGAEIGRASLPAADGAAAGEAGGVASPRMFAWARANWAVLAVFAAFALSAAIVPTFAPVATTDDWAYTRSAQILLAEGRLTVFPVVAATAVFQIAWGALFGVLFGPTFGAFRLSTVVITALGAVALFGLCRDLGVTRGRGALGVAAYLFNPLVFVLAFTFMTDAHFAALLVIATWLFAKALGSLTPNSSSTAVSQGEVGNKCSLEHDNKPLSHRSGRGAWGEGQRHGSGLFLHTSPCQPPHREKGLG